jgi:hypothetical protein
MVKCRKDKGERQNLTGIDRMSRIKAKLIKLS